MRCARSSRLALPLLGLSLMISGCYGPQGVPYGQSPYGPGPYGSPYGGGYPGTGVYPGQGAPVQTLQPGAPYTPYGNTPYGTQFPQESNVPPSAIDQTGGDAPFYGQGNTSNPQPYDGGGVPTYNDADQIQFDTQNFQQPVQPDQTAVEEFGSLEGASAEMAGVAKVNLDTADFVQPLRSSVAQQTTFSSLPAAPYAYDGKYEWLRGVLSFDASSGHWTMIYSDHPANDDAHRGRLIVADSALLAPHKPRAIVLLHGEVDARLSQSAGRAMYRVDAVEPVELPTP